MEQLMNSVVAFACGLDEIDDIDYINQVREAAMKVLESKTDDTLKVICSQGPISDGDVPSKSDRNALLTIGVITKCIVKGEDGYQVCNYLGRDVVRALGVKG